jgi:hypothetical protein
MCASSGADKEIDTMDAPEVEAVAGRSVEEEPLPGIRVTIDGVDEYYAATRHGALEAARDLLEWGLDAERT